MAKKNKQTSRLLQAGQAPDPQWPLFTQAGTGRVPDDEGPRAARGPGLGLPTQPDKQRDGTQRGGSTSPRCFPFTLFTGFRNDFILENEQTQPDLSGHTHTGDTYMGTQAHTHICTEAHRHMRAHLKKLMGLLTGASWELTCLWVCPTTISEVPLPVRVNWSLAVELPCLLYIPQNLPPV